MVKAVLPVKRMGDFAGRMWEQHKIWLMTSEADATTPPTIRFSLPVYVRMRDLDRVLGLLRSELLQRA